MKKIIFVIILSLFLKNGVAQTNNLVPNGDFEYYTGCPFMMGQIDSAYPWTQPNILGSSSDYLNTCNNFIYPTFFIDYPPRSGNGFAGILPSDFYVYIDYREYISNHLTTPLMHNKKYCAKFFVIRWKTNNILIDAFGLLFTNNFVVQSSLMVPLLYTAQVKNQRGNILASATNWMKISGSFIAQGGEQYITIGNFEQQDSVTRVYLGTFPTSCSYNIDDVSVCDCEDFKPKLGRDTTLCAGQQLLLKANVPKEADSVVYTWQDGSKDSTFLVTKPGTYWVSAYIEDYKITVTDSIRVNYTECNTPQLWIPNSFTPNGDGLNDKFEYGNAENYEIKTTIYNRWGQLIFESENTDFWDGKYKGKTVTFGTYIYHIEAIRKDTMEKKIHCGRITVL
jgi:gliding motility-associated-like protein